MKSIIRSTFEARRAFLQVTTAGLALAACSSSASRREEGEGDEAEVTPGEDLMQEHGVLERVLLVYDEVARKIRLNDTFDATVVVRAADVVRRFVEDYHEHNEEQHVFPRLESAHREVELVAVLRKQHQRGREVTDEIVRIAKSSDPSRVGVLLESFARMYRPHAAREDTVLFPAFRATLGRDAYRELGEQFEDEEHRRFGEDGFEKAVNEVAQLEASLAIGDLARFTP
jgi:hemerythrin-like domain-containing protein